MLVVREVQLPELNNQGDLSVLIAELFFSKACLRLWSVHTTTQAFPRVACRSPGAAWPHQALSSHPGAMARHSPR